jgi:hypothetical protein
VKLALTKSKRTIEFSIILEFGGLSQNNTGVKPFELSSLTSDKTHV